VRFRRYALLLGCCSPRFVLLTVQARGGGPTRAGDLLALASIRPERARQVHRGRPRPTWHTSRTGRKTVRTRTRPSGPTTSACTCRRCRFARRSGRNRRLRRLLFASPTVFPSPPLPERSSARGGRAGPGPFTVQSRPRRRHRQRCRPSSPKVYVRSCRPGPVGCSVVQLLNDPPPRWGGSHSARGRAGLGEGSRAAGCASSLWRATEPGVTAGRSDRHLRVGTLSPRHTGRTRDSHRGTRARPSSLRRGGTRRGLRAGRRSPAPHGQSRRTSPASSFRR